MSQSIRSSTTLPGLRVWDLVVLNDEVRRGRLGKVEVMVVWSKVGVFFKGGGSGEKAHMQSAISSTSQRKCSYQTAREADMV